MNALGDFALEQENKPIKTKWSRRQFLAGLSGTAAMAGITLGNHTKPSYAGLANDAGKVQQICIFSKHLQWLDYAGMAETAAEIGFDGLDLTVRPGGHVLPERVEDDLPKAVEAVKKTGLSVPMITTRINDHNDRLTEPILKTASQLGIRYYRLGYYKYEESKSIPARLAEIKPMLQGLVELNKQYNICGDYQNHAGSDRVGAPLWDLWELMKDLDSRWLGVQFDIRHATVEGGTVWPINFRLVASRTHTIVIKDFKWEKTPKGWQLQNCPLDQGMVDFRKYFKMLKQIGFSGPLSMHFEYPLGGANKGIRKLDIPRAKVIEAMRSDLRQLKTWLGEFELKI